MRRSTRYCAPVKHGVKPPKDVEEAISNIDSWYNSGKPFFNRDSIKEIHEQLQKSPKPGDIIHSRCLNGEQVSFEVRTGETYTANYRRYKMEAPCIAYLSLQSLKSFLSPVALHLAYCNLQISHLTMVYNIKNDEPPDEFSLKTQEEVDRLFKTAVQVWQESEIWTRIKSTLMAAKFAPNIRKIIGLGCGTMSFANAPLNLSNSAAVQHALLLTIQSLLQNKTDTTTDKISCYTQDPAYTDMDKSVLQESGIIVLDDPEGFLEVDDSTVVFSCAPNVPVKQIIADIARPTIIIWDKVLEGKAGEWIDGLTQTDPDSPRVRKMIHDYYDTFEFPSDEHFVEMAIYIRRNDVS